MSNSRMNIIIAIISVGAYVGGIGVMFKFDLVIGMLLSMLGVFIGLFYKMVCEEA